MSTGNFPFKGTVLLPASDPDAPDALAAPVALPGYPPEQPDPAATLDAPVARQPGAVVGSPGSPGAGSPGVSVAAPVRSGSQPSLPGDEPLLAGKYRLVRLIGKGGMGAVYEARHEELGKRMAVKLVNSDGGHRQEMIDRFRREARATGAIDSEHIVQVFDAGYDPAHGLYMAMEFLRGCDLATALQRIERLDLDAACNLVAQVAVGLQAAHDAGIVHRDLKPANIFLVPRSDGSLLVKLVDFGIAKVLDESHPSNASLHPGLTRSGSVVGTPQYMSPEQAQGLRDVDARSDMYSLGAVLHEALVGTPMVPLLATYEQTILHIMTRPVPALRDGRPDAPEALAKLYASMVALDPSARPRDMGHVVTALLEAHPTLASRPLQIEGLVFDSSERGPRSFSHPSLVGLPGKRAPARAAAADRTGDPARAVGHASDPAGPDEPLAIPLRPSRAPLVAAALLALGVIGWWSLHSASAPAPDAATSTGAVASAQATPPAPPSATAGVPVVTLTASAVTASPAPSAAPSARPSRSAAGPPGRDHAPTHDAPAASKDRKIGGAGLAETF